MSDVLDASAVLAWILREPGHMHVQALLERGDCVVSAVNAAEVVSKLMDKNRPHAALKQVIDHFGAPCIAFDAQQATDAGLLRQATRVKGLSLGDRACLALAKQRGGTAYTADRSWLELAEPLGIRIACIRPD